AEYASMFAVSGAAAILFLGGWHSGLLPFEPSERLGWPGHVLDMLVFVGKGWLLVVVMMWLRWSLPRLRIDQVMMTCLKYFLPISFGLLVGVGGWRLYLHPLIGGYTKYVLVFGTLLFGLIVFASLFTAKGVAPRRELEGVW